MELSIYSETDLETLAIRIGQLKKAEPNSPEAKELKHLMKILIAYEKKNIHLLNQQIISKDNWN